MSTKKRKSNKGILLKGILEKVPKESFDVLRKELKDILSGNSGIYALYKKDRVVYVGLATDLYWRNFHHLTRDRLVGKWDSFSIFIIQRVRYLKDLETLVLRISKPKYNKATGKLPHHHFLKKRLRKVAKTLKNEAQGIELALR